MNIKEWKLRNIKENDISIDTNININKYKGIFGIKCFECSNQDRKSLYNLRYCMHLLCKNCLTSNSATNKILICKCGIEYDTTSADISSKHYYEKLYEHDSLYRKFVCDNNLRIPSNFNNNEEYNTYLKNLEHSIINLQINKENINNLTNSNNVKNKYLIDNDESKVNINANKIYRDSRIVALYNFEINSAPQNMFQDSNIGISDNLNNNISNKGKLKAKLVKLFENDALLLKNKKNKISGLLNISTANINKVNNINIERIQDITKNKNLPRYISASTVKKNNKILEKRAGGVTISYSYLGKLSTFEDGLI